MRLIDADAAGSIENLDDYGNFALGIGEISDARELLNAAPTIDAIPVVHCKDCKFLGVKDLGDGYCKKKMAGIISPYDFCSYGERRDREK